jgi:NADH-quinone oxidoreductase subunit H
MWVPWPERRKTYTGLRGLIVACARLTYRIGGPLLKRLAPVVFTGTVVAGLVGIWLVAALLMPLLQEPGWRHVVRDLIIVVAVLGFITVTAMYCIWWERKVAGRIQSRVGPMRTGGWHGWAQSLADGIKCITKEDAVPGSADRLLFRLAPYLSFVPAVCAFLVLPFGAYWVFRDLDSALILLLGLIGIDVLGILVAGWASNSRWSLLGAMREGCQVVSYEIPMGMSLLIPVMCAGTLQLSEIGAMQAGGWFTWLAFRSPFTFVALFTYFIASLASCKRAPFDLPEAESELVGGFHTEYSGFRWAVFFFGEYAAMFVVSGVAVIMFLGGWHSPLPASWGQVLGDGWLAKAGRGLLFSGPLWFVGKCVFFIYVHMWLRWTLPRLRIDQLLYSCVQVMLPLTMVLLLGNTVWELFYSPVHPVFSLVAQIAGYVMAVLGAILAGGFIGIGGHGLLNRRRLVGRLAIDHLPGA